VTQFGSPSHVISHVGSHVELDASFDAGVAAAAGDAVTVAVAAAVFAQQIAPLVPQPTTLISSMHGPPGSTQTPPPATHALTGPPSEELAPASLPAGEARHDATHATTTAREREFQPCAETEDTIGHLSSRLPEPAAPGQVFRCDVDRDFAPPQGADGPARAPRGTYCCEEGAIAVRSRILGGMPRPRSAATAFILSLPSDLSAGDVVARARAHGLDATEQSVYQARRLRARKGAKSTLVYAAREKTSTRTPAVTKNATGKKPVASTKATVRQPARRAAVPANKSRGRNVAAISSESMAEFVRARAHLSPKEIVEDSVAHGSTLDAAYVYSVRGYDTAVARKAEQRTSRAAKRGAPSAESTAGLPPADARVVSLLKAAAAELGIGLALAILAEERAGIMAVLAG